MTSTVFPTVATVLLTDAAVKGSMDKEIIYRPESSSVTKHMISMHKALGAIPSSKQNKKESPH